MSSGAHDEDDTMQTIAKLKHEVMLIVPLTPL